MTMLYLKCTNCGHYNELKTEYITFCTNCNKILSDNFPDWKKRNPDRTLDDFKKIVCTEDKEEPILKKTKSKLPTSAKVGIGFIISFAIFYAIGQLGGEYIVSKLRGPLYDKQMMEFASEINKNCPIMIDNATRFDNATPLPGKVFQYNYTLINMVKDSFDAEELKKNLEPSVINFVKSNPEMKTVRVNKVTINYSYRDKNGTFLFTITVTPDLYVEDTKTNPKES
jgi:hypothetical protein